MKTNLLFASIFMLFVTNLLAQGGSNFRVRYMVTQDEMSHVYTAWVVPEYNTPNYNNGDSEEKGATAQFTLKVSKGFSLSGIQDIKGNWDKQPFKISPVALGIDAASKYEYYVIGKEVGETNYGVFQDNAPVALFSFKGEGNTAEVSALENTDSFINLAKNKASLNVSSSFYSRSGQRPLMDAKPLEQFAAPITIETVLKNELARVGIEKSNQPNEVVNQVITYPNPATDVVTVKYFSDETSAQLKIELIDLKGNIESSQKLTTKLGFNLIKINMSKLPSASYIIRSAQGKKITTQKLIKLND
jgi:Secretion system C-terminal sorting domain